MHKIIDILIIGPLADMDLVYANAILKETENLNLLIVRKEKYEIRNKKELKYLYPFIQEDKHILYTNSSFKFFKLAMKSDVILSFTGSAMGLFKWFFLYKILFGKPKIINRMTGADFRELYWQKNIQSFAYRLFMKYCDTHNIGYMESHVEGSIKAKLKDVFFLNVPFAITDISKLQAETFKHSNIFRFQKEKNNIIFFVPSYFNKDKNNVLFIEAFIEVLKTRKDIFCVFINDGSKLSLEIQKQIKVNKLENFFYIINGRLPKYELHYYMSLSDVIVDQFVMGSMGGIAIEALKLRKPIMIYINPIYWKLIYSLEPPVINIQRKKDIKDFLMKVSNVEIEHISKKIEYWLQVEQSDKMLIARLLYHCSRITGINYLKYLRGK